VFLGASILVSSRLLLPQRLQVRQRTASCSLLSVFRNAGSYSLFVAAFWPTDLSRNLIFFPPPAPLYSSIGYVLPSPSLSALHFLEKTFQILSLASVVSFGLARLLDKPVSATEVPFFFELSVSLFSLAFFPSSFFVDYQGLSSCVDTFCVLFFWFLDIMSPLIR